MSAHANHSNTGTTHSQEAHGEEHHGHVIIPLATLRLVLGALLVFTLLTVGLSKGEGLLSETFNFEVPQWVNVLVAMSIACIKTALVVLIFMQLKYDSPINSMIFIFTLVTVCFFLGFTMIDLGNRQTLERFKGVYISPGGTGLDGNGPITEKARIDAELKGDHQEAHAAGPHESAPVLINGRSYIKSPKGMFTDSGYKDMLPVSGSSEELARPVKGLTLPGFAPANDQSHSQHAPGSTGGH